MAVDPASALRAVQERVAAGERLKDVTADVAAATGLSRKDLYNAALAARKAPEAARRGRRPRGEPARTGATRRPPRIHPMSKVLSAVAWPYANGPRHIGHVAGFGVPSDVFSRYMRMAGHDVLMVSGTDEHGTPILVAADEAGVSAAGAGRHATTRLIVEDLRRPRPVLRPVHPHHDRATTTRVVQEMFTHRPPQRLHGRADHPGRDLARRPGAPCPTATSRAPARSAATPSARGDQCDNCGNQLDPTDLIDPRSKINGETPEFVETQHFFLDLPALADALEEWLDEREASGTWRPNVIKFSQNILEDIRPRAMTRDIDWGIPVPLDGWRDNPTKRLYVWFDAVIGYLSASIEWARRTRRPRALARVVERPGGAVLLLHGQGQHHLPLPDLAGRAARVRRARATGAASRGRTASCNLPTEVVSSEFLTMEGKQFSSSRGVRDLRRATCWPATSPTRCATSSARPARRTRTPTSPGPSSSSAPTPSSSPAGATWSTAPPR